MPVTPGILHPAAATSFANTLRSSLRSVLCVARFEYHTRALGELPVKQWQYHFAQTIPLCRRGRPTGDFHWLRTDPRPGVELDLRQLPLRHSDDPHRLSRGWEELERAFGVTREQRAARESGDDNNAGLRLYICPTVRWPTAMMHEVLVPGEEGSREELARYLQVEADDWLSKRIFFEMVTNGSRPLAKHGCMIDAESFEMMEKFPCTAIGMWLFPADAFRERIAPPRNCFDVSAVQPGLFLFEL